MKGKALLSKTFKGLLKGSYDGTEKVDGFELDKSLSTKTSKVYHDPKTNKTAFSLSILLENILSNS